MEFSSKDIFYFGFSIIFLLCSFLFKNKTRYFLVSLILFFPFEAGLIFYRFHGIMLTDLPILVLIGIGLTSGKKFKIIIPYIGWPVFIFFIWSMLGIFNTWIPGYVISDSMRILRGYLVIVCIVNFAKTPKDLKLVVTALFAGLAFQSFLGIYQWRFGAIGLRILGETPYIGWRSRGTFQHESYFGNYLAFLIPVVYRMFVFYKAKTQQEQIKYGVLFAVSTLALFTTFTRGPWISFAFAVMAVTLWSFHKRKLRPKKMIPITIVMVFGIIFLIKYTPSIVSQFDPEGGRQYAANIRMPLNRIAVRIIKAYPIMGVGQGMYNMYSPDFVHEHEEGVEDWEVDQLKWDMVHNSYLKIGAETGVPGLAMFLWFIFMVIKIGYKNIKSVDPYLSNLSIGILTGYLAILVSFLASPDIRIHQINIMFWLMGAILLSIQNLDKKYKNFIKYQKIERLTKVPVSTN